MFKMNRLLLGLAIPIMLPLQRSKEAVAARNLAPAMRMTGRNVAVIDAAFQRNCNASCLVCTDKVYYSYTSGNDAPGNPDQTCTYASCSKCGKTTPVRGLPAEASEAEAVEVLRQAAALDDPGPLTELLAGSTQLRYNAKRHSIQVLACDSKSIAANVPVSRDLQAVVAAAARESGRIVSEE